jgi:hypothetical protein
LILFIGLWANYPNDITGKWQVEEVIASKIDDKVTEQQKASALTFIKHTFMNAIFDFRADHRFYLSPILQTMPKGQSWKYDSNNGIIKITQTKGIGTIMSIKIIEKNDTTFFALDETLII